MWQSNRPYLTATALTRILTEAKASAMIEWLSSIGPLTNLFDRLAKGRPTASFTVKDQGTQKLGCIRITNNGNYDIAIIDTNVKPDVYFLTEDKAVGTLLRGAAGRKPTFTLRPQEAKELIIGRRYASDGTVKDRVNQNVTFRISWRRCNRTSQPRIPVYVRTNTSIVRQYANP
jgi:hypothetical protein